MSQKRARKVAERKRKQQLRKRQRRIQYRLRDIDWSPQEEPMFSASNIYYEIADRTRATSAGGIGLIHRMVNELGLREEIDSKLRLLKVHLPYHESDHVLNIAYNALAGGQCLEDLELLRNDEAYLDALGAQRIPDPTTEGDFCRRFEEAAPIETLMSCINETRLRVWKCQPASFLEDAIIEGDGTLMPTTGECKEGMDISYKGSWGYHPLLISLANTAEPLFLVNRSGNRPSQEGAAGRFDQAIDLCRRAGFKKIRLRGDTDFSQTSYLDGWDAQGVCFVFGYDAHAKLVEKATKLGDKAWERLERPAPYEVQTLPRSRPENVKERIVEERGYTNLELESEDVAEFQYSPTKCKKTYRMVVVRKNIHVKKGTHLLFDEARYLFYITNDWTSPTGDIVLQANKRCNQERLIDQLKNHVRALRANVNTLLSNWACMVMVSLAWSLKAWFALLLPENGRWGEKHRQEKETVLRMGFRRFVNVFMNIPAQIVRTGRRLVFRLLAWNPYLHIFLRLDETLSQQLRC